MNLKFKKITLHNFLSFGDASVELNNRGYVLVTGKNENPDDNSQSNGSGKSSIFEAIAWCLCGETIRGAKEIVNINGEDGAYVELELTVDNKNYRILRAKNHKVYKTTLKIYIDDVDKSGKGIRDSEALLAEYLPDLTSSLIGSVIVLGQGLPQRFTSNTPAGRKDILEKLSKSDFMIEDLKNRIAERKTLLQKQLRDIEDCITSDSGKLAVYTTQLDSKKSELSSMNADSLDNTITEYTGKVQDYSNILSQKQEQLANTTKLLNDKRAEYSEFANILNSELAKIDTEFPSMADIDKKYPTLVEIESKYPTVNEINSKYPSPTEIESQFPSNIEIANQFPSNSDIEKKYNIIETYRQSLTEITSKIIALNKEISEKDNISDICPTCGQKLKGVVKIDTKPLKETVLKLTGDKAVTTKYLNEQIDKMSSEKALIESQVRQAQNDNAKLILEAKNKVEQSKREELNRVNSEKRAEIEKINQEKALEKERISKEIAIKKQEVNDKFVEKKEALINEGKELGNQVNTLSQQVNDYKKLFDSATQILTKAQLERNQYDKVKDSLTKEIETITNTVKELTDKILYNNSDKDSTQAHIDVISKFETAIKRDFRGYLLTNVIEYISKKAKEYSMDVFETDKITFALDGNNINIGYNGKEYSSLSGGEKQKVDLIVQFSIRDMLCQYLGFSSNILVVDEIFDNLDSKGCEKVVNLISNRLYDISSVLIVTHHRDIEIPCDNEIVVIKSKDGVSRIS